MKTLGLIAPALVASAFVCWATVATASGGAELCPAWVTPAAVPPPTTTTPAATTTTPGTTTTAAPVASTMVRAASLPAIAYVSGSTMVGARSAVLSGSVSVGAGEVAVTAEYWQSGSPSSCTQVQHPHERGIELTLSGLQPLQRYRFRLVADGVAGVAVSKAGTFVTLPAGVIAEGVSIGMTPVGRLSRVAALARLNHAAGAPIRLTYAGAYWRVLPSQVGAHFEIARSVTSAVGATPGLELPRPTTSVDATRLRAYVAALAHRWSRKPAQGAVRLVGTRAVVTPKRPGVAVASSRMAAEIEGELTTGKRTLLSLAVQMTRVSAASQQKAVVVRLGTQTLTAYLNGKPILTAPVTTGRPALPTPIGSFKVQFRASPYTFYSPWPKGSAYWYPPAPVTWAMEFYDGDFLHNDPAEPSDAFGSDSQNGYFASHGCVHVPDSAMAFLYNWLPVGAPVIVSER